MAIKKSELYSSLWKSCDELRGGMDASQYKDYILVLLFVKYVSDKYADDKNALIEIPKGGSFSDMVALKGNKKIGEGINKIIAALAKPNELKGVIDVADFDDDDKLGKGKEMVDRLTNLVAIFENENLNFSKNRADGDDILGDAYEYLMRHFATESGKSKGQFYTPSEVSRIMAKVIGVHDAKRQDQTIYDPTCGSGSLLLKAADEAQRGVTIYGQEMDNATAALAIMNMWLHNNPTAEIKKDNTLSNPLFKNDNGNLKTFDFAVANPPFSTKAWSSGFAVYPPTGRLRVAAPLSINDEAVRLFVISKLPWIKKHQVNIGSQDRQSVRQYVSGESHYFNGKRYRLNVIYQNGTPKVEVRNKSYIDIYVREGFGLDQRRKVMVEWYRSELKKQIPDLISQWEKVIKVRVNDWGVKQMKTRWGTCNISSKRIWLNLELSKKPLHCLEFIIVHEMVHLLERLHNDRFIGFMDKYLPNWRFCKEELNRYPLCENMRKC